MTSGEPESYESGDAGLGYSCYYHSMVRPRSFRELTFAHVHARLRNTATGILVESVTKVSQGVDIFEIHEKTATFSSEEESAF